MRCSSCLVFTGVIFSMLYGYGDSGVSNLHMLDGTDIAEVAGSDVFFEIVSPSTLSYTFRSRPAKGFTSSFNVTMYGVKLTPVDPPCGCSPYLNGEDVEGTVALIERGECSFVTKAVQAQKAGAIAALIMDSDASNDDQLIDMVDDHTGREVDIPAGFISGKDGSMIKRSLERLNLPYAIINIPVNVTRHGTKVKFPPWLVW